MPTLPWTTPNPVPPHAGTFVMASRFEVRSVSDVPRFFLQSLVAWRQVRSAPGAYGASLIAHPLKREFFTLSAWESRDALYAYSEAEPHRGVVTKVRSSMRMSTFVFWEVDAEKLPIAWDDAKRRLAEKAAADAARRAGAGN